MISINNWTPSIVPNLPYNKAQELWVITVYYNPCNYVSRRSTYDIFIAKMRSSGINILTIECAFWKDLFQLPDTSDIIKIRSNSLMWQKERLINIGSLHLPEDCKYVAWIDCDIIFQNLNWAQEACDLLSESCTVVQLWERWLLLEKDNKIPEVQNYVSSYAAVTSRNKTVLDSGKYENHWHTGYAWAMRRNMFEEVWLYEYCVIWSADHFMAHAIYNQYWHCVESAYKQNPLHFDHLKHWGEKFHKYAQGKLWFVSWNIYHLWHGTHERRNYFYRVWKLAEYGYDPDLDLIAEKGKPFEWKRSTLKGKPQLIKFFAEYFTARQEDTE